MTPDLIIFDCDGVLVDSEIVAARIEADLLTQAGFPIEAGELAERYAGLTFRDILLAVEKEAQIPLQASLLDRAERLVDDKLSSSVRAIDGAREAVARVTLPKCICSNSSPQRLEAMLGRTGLLPFFAGRVFSAKADPAMRPKPAPDVFLKAVGAMNADPARCFAIEDSEHGVHAARAAGIRVIGFTGASHSWPGHADRLTDAGADTVIHRFADLQSTIDALSVWAE